MNELGAFQLIVLPIALGLLGFIEPCSVGSSLIFVKFLENKSASAKLVQTAIFAATRAAFIGALGMIAVLVGGVFVSYQKAAWAALGLLYLLLGALLMTGRARPLMVALGPRLHRLSGARASVGLGLLFGLNIPACAAPLLVALLAMAGATGASQAAFASGFVSLALFGLALSLPLVAAVYFEPARRLLDRLAHHSARYPKWAGALLIALGLWSIRYGLVVEGPTP